MPTAAIALNPRRVCLALACALVALAAGAGVAHAGTWYINPTITNYTRSTYQSPCGAGHSNWAGCVILDSSAVNDGGWTANPYGNTGGRRTLPATCASGVSNCADGAGPGNPSPPNVDQPSFNAPNFDEGADGYYEYTMPDGHHYSMVAEDDENGFGQLAAAYPGCAANPGENDAYACLATYPSGVKGDPSSSPFNPSFTFYAQSGAWGYIAAPYIAAGQVCSEGSGPFECTVGRTCPSFSGGGPVLNCTAVPGGGEWSPTDPSNYMFLTFYDVSSSGPVTITDLGAEPSGTWFVPLPASPTSCTIQKSGQTCSIYTSGGCALATGRGTHSLKNACGSDAIQINDGSGSHATVEVLDEAEIPDDLGQQWSAEDAQAIEIACNQAFSVFGSTGYGDPEAVEPRPVLENLRVSAGARAQRSSSQAPGPERSLRLSSLRLAVSYRDSAPATTVLTLARALPGDRRGGRCVASDGDEDGAAGGCTRWVPLPGRRVRYSTDMYWVPRRSRSCHRVAGGCGRSGCPAPAARSRGRCHLRLRLYGHARHRDTVGRNTLPLRPAGRRGLAPGRYRLSGVAAIGARTSRRVSVVFTVRP